MHDTTSSRNMPKYDLDLALLYQYNCADSSFSGGIRSLETPVMKAKLNGAMSNTTKRTVLGRGKGYLNAAGPQSRFIIFLIFVLMAYTLLLRVFQKLAEILQLPVFLPISLITLLLFIGVVGTVYSHSFVGPLSRIRRSVDQLARGDLAISLKLRESDDPMLKELVASIMHLSQHTRSTHVLIQTSAQDFFTDITALQDLMEKGADKDEIRKQIDQVRKKQELLEKAVRSLGTA